MSNAEPRPENKAVQGVDGPQVQAPSPAIQRELSEKSGSIDSMNVPPPTGSDRPMMMVDNAGNAIPNDPPPMPA